MRAFIAFLVTAGLAMNNADASEPQVLFTFDSASGSEWSAVNDTVMGGRSDAGSEIRDGVLHFRGNLSLENYGGFASLRHAVDLDLGNRSGIRLRVKGDGRSYQLLLHGDSRYLGRPVAYSAAFKTQAGKWVEVDVPFDELSASFRGRQLDGYRFDPGKIELVGILLGDKKPGPFHLEINRIVAY